MNGGVAREVSGALREQSRIAARLRRAEVVDDSPLTILLGGEEVSAAIVSGASVGIGDLVDVLVAGYRPPLILAGGGGGGAGQGSIWIPEGFGATASGSPTANMLYATRVKIMGTDAITGIEFRPTNTTGSVKPVLFDSSGTQVAIGSGATLAGSGFGAKQQVAFSSAYTPTPGVYYLGLAFNNASSTYTTIGVVPRGGTKSSAYTTPGNLSSVPSDALATPPLMWTY